MSETKLWMSDSGQEKGFYSNKQLNSILSRFHTFPLALNKIKKKKCQQAYENSNQNEGYRDASQ